MSLNYEPRPEPDESPVVPFDRASRSRQGEPPVERAPSDHTCSVVIVSYKTGPVLLECLRSVLNQEPVRQVILVDNGNSKGLLEEIEVIRAGDERLSIISGHGNVGFSTGCNLGAVAATSSHLLLLNPDCVIGENVLAESLTVFDDDPDAWMVTVQIQNPDGTEQRGCRRNMLTPWTSLVEQFRLDRLAPDHPHFKRLNLNETEQFEEITEVQCISGAFMLMPKRIFDSLGGMDEDYFLHVEDIDFCMRIAKRGGRILYVPDITITHMRGTSRVHPGFVEWHKSVSVVKYFFKHFQPQYPRMLLRIVAAAIFVRYALRLMPITLGWLAELTGLSKLVADDTPAMSTTEPVARRRKVNP
jgi:GT2 family glycosyltransferase